MENKEISEKRRKLVLASAATPLAATLKSGAAMAASSAVCTPLEGDISNIKFASQGNSLYGDTAVRYQVPTMKKNPSSGAAESNYIYNIEGTWYYHSGHVFYGDMNDYEPHESAYVLVLYGTDEQGTYEVGLWPKFQKDYLYGDGRFPINASCLTSISVTGNFNYTGM
jgi:hypothetical protein